MKFAYIIEPPFNYRDKAGKVLGCDVELAQHVCSIISDKEFEPTETNFADLLTGLNEQRWDMATAMFAIPERQKIANFSKPIWALTDGLLVKAGNPRNLQGYASIAKDKNCKLAVIRNQVQQRFAIESGTQEDQILVFDTYPQAASAVETGLADAYLSVFRAHKEYVDQNPDLGLDVIQIEADEKKPGFGSFSFALDKAGLRNEVDEVLASFIGSDNHRKMMARYGFTDKEIDLLL